MRFIVDEHLPASFTPGGRESAALAGETFQGMNVAPRQLSGCVRLEVTADYFGIALVALQNQVGVIVSDAACVTLAKTGRYPQRPVASNRAKKSRGLCEFTSRCLN